MLRIGEFSVLTNISISMLRNYDKIGLLVPELIDDSTGYRYYTKNQIVLANKIVALKEMGFSLDEIIILTQEKSLDLAMFLEKKKIQKLAELKEIEEQIKRLSVANNKNIEQNYALDVVTKEMPAMLVLGYKETIDYFNEEGILWEKINEFIAKNYQKINHNALSMAINNGYNDEGLIDANVEVEIPKEVTIEDSNFYFKRYPKRLIASITFKGGYAQIAMLNSFLATWLEENHYELAGQSFSIYHTSPGDKVSEIDYITELCFPIKNN